MVRERERKREGSARKVCGHRRTRVVMRRKVYETCETLLSSYLTSKIIQKSSFNYCFRRTFESTNFRSVLKRRSRVIVLFHEGGSIQSESRWSMLMIQGPDVLMKRNLSDKILLRTTVVLTTLLVRNYWSVGRTFVMISIVVCRPTQSNLSWRRYLDTRSPITIHVERHEVCRRRRFCYCFYAIQV